MEMFYALFGTAAGVSICWNAKPFLFFSIRMRQGNESSSIEVEFSKNGTRRFCDVSMSQLLAKGVPAIDTIFHATKIMPLTCFLGLDSM